MDSYFDINISPELIAIYAVALVSMIFVMAGWCRRVQKVSRSVASDSSAPLPDHGYPDVSVIVYSNDDAWNLEALLRRILTQDYPSALEVIVVNDGASSATEEVIGRLESEFGNLYMTFTPLDSRNLSRKKLAITLGIKAARYEVVVMTQGNAMIQSDNWLRHIARHFADGKEVVIGYAYPSTPHGADESAGKRIRAFDTVFTAVKYLSAAIGGNPYRGNPYNLAYRKSLFFKNKGFSRSLNLRYGDDDIFLSEIATGSNTAVELATESMVADLESNPAKAHRDDRIRHDFTGKYVSKSSGVIAGIALLSWWILTICSVTGAILGLPSLIPAIVSAVMLIATAVVMIVSWRRTSIALQSRSLMLSVPLLMWYMPLYGLCYKIIGYRNRSKHKTAGK